MNDFECAVRIPPFVGQSVEARDLLRIGGAPAIGEDFLRSLSSTRAVLFV
jgi:hypothetical protein